MDHWRQLDLVSPSHFTNERVTVIGAGGIGSPTVLSLAKMGVSQIMVYDPDLVELHNLPNQMYRFEDIGKAKVSALSEIVYSFAGVEIEGKEEKFEAQQISGIVISGVDSMAARKAIWNRVKYNPSVKLYIEARMGAEVGRIHSLKPWDPTLVQWYESTLYDDEQATEDACTARAIIYNTGVIAGFIAAQLKKFVKNEEVRKEIIFDMSNFIFIV